MTTTGGAGALLRRARVARGVGVRELARRTGVAPSTISLYENGRREPSVSALERLLRAVGADLDVRPAVRDAGDRAAVLERVCAIGMALPRRDRGALTYPTFESLTDRG